MIAEASTAASPISVKKLGNHIFSAGWARPAIDDGPAGAPLKAGEPEREGILPHPRKIPRSADGNSHLWMNL